MPDKAELLAAIAAAGTQGKLDYERAQAANSQMQADAIRAALSNGIAQSAGGGAQADLARIIGQPYQLADSHIAANKAAQDTWFNTARWNSGIYQGHIDQLREALIARALMEAAAGGGSGGGGGGGGGGGDEAFDWYDNLRDTFGTQKLGFAAIASEAKNLGLNSSNETGLPRYLQTRQYAQDEYGVPASVAEGQYGMSEFGDAIMTDAGVAPMKNLKQFKAFVKNARAGEKSTKGSQAYWVREAKQKAMSRLPKKAQRKIKKRQRRRR